MSIDWGLQGLVADESGTAHDSSPAHTVSSKAKAAVSGKHTKAAVSSKHKAASGSAHGAASDVKSLFGERVEKAHSQKHHDATVDKQQDETDLVIQLKNLRREATAFAHQISAARYLHASATRYEICMFEIPAV